MKIPNVYRKIFEDLNIKDDYLYLDSLALVIAWRNQNQLELPKGKTYWVKSGSKISVFMKYVSELINRFYLYHYERESDVGIRFAKWLLGTPINYKPPIKHHSELGSLYE